MFDIIICEIHKNADIGLFRQSQQISKVWIIKKAEPNDPAFYIFMIYSIS